MIGKLNTRFFDHTQNVADHSGWEALRVIIDFMNKPPDNAKFQMDMKLIQVDPGQGGQVHRWQEREGRDEDHPDHRERHGSIPQNRWIFP